MADYQISSANLSAIENGLDAINRNLGTLNNNLEVVDHHVDNVDNNVKVVYNEIDALARDFHDFVQVQVKVYIPKPQSALHGQCEQPFR